jgi:hypothetical protein
VIDYRKLNELLRDEVPTVPQEADIWAALSGAKYFSHLSLPGKAFQVECFASRVKSSSSLTHFLDIEYLKRD